MSPSTAAHSFKVNDPRLVAPDNPAGIEWVEVPAGEFLYGEIQQPLSLPGFLIARYPVTQLQYQRFIDANPAHPVPQGGFWESDQAWDTDSRRHLPGRSDHPVVLVSWEDAQAFCQWARCRLPTEQEWEKAARGSDGRSFPWGEGWSMGRHCNSGAGFPGSAPVDAYPLGASPYGVFDMAGNTAEITGSLYGDETISFQVDTDSFHKLETSGAYVLRGSSWSIDLDWRVYNRVWIFPHIVGETTGFRCARSLE